MPVWAACITGEHDVPESDRPAVLARAKAARERVSRLEAQVAKSEESRGMLAGVTEAIRRAGGWVEYKRQQEQARKDAEEARRKRQEEVAAIGRAEAAENQKRLERDRKILVAPTLWKGEAWRRAGCELAGRAEAALLPGGPADRAHRQGVRAGQARSGGQTRRGAARLPAGALRLTLSTC